MWTEEEHPGRRKAGPEVGAYAYHVPGPAKRSR